MYHFLNKKLHQDIGATVYLAMYGCYLSCLLAFAGLLDVTGHCPFLLFSLALASYIVFVALMPPLSLCTIFLVQFSTLPSMVFTLV